MSNVAEFETINRRMSALVARKMAAEHVSMRELARRSGIPRSTLRGRIKGSRGPWYTNEMDVVARGFGMHIVEFVRELESTA